jgi:hypothetical protein
MPIEPELFINLDEERIALDLKYFNVQAEYNEFKALYKLVAVKAENVLKQEAEEAERVEEDTPGEAKVTPGKTPDKTEGLPQDVNAGRGKVVTIHIREFLHRFSDVEGRLKAVCRQSEVLGKKEHCADVFKQAVKVPNSVSQADWNEAAQDVDLEALFGPYYPREPWPKEVPYLDMIGLLKFCLAKKEAADIKGN